MMLTSFILGGFCCAVVVLLWEAAKAWQDSHYNL